MRDLEARGYKEVTLLGQNVNSYLWKADADAQELNFAALLRTVARAVPGMRIRFSTSHPKDMSDETLHVIAEEPMCAVTSTCPYKVVRAAFWSL